MRKNRIFLLQYNLRRFRTIEIEKQFDLTVIRIRQKNPDSDPKQCFQFIKSILSNAFFSILNVENLKHRD